jgi:hypothetical protein
MISRRWCAPVLSLALRACAVTLGLLLAGDVRACSTPVFRHALENWAPSPYEAVVLHRGPLSAEALRAVQLLEEAPTNVEVRQVDAAAVTEDLRRVWEKGDPQMSAPWLVLRRESGDERVVVWSGPLNAANATAVLDSPARREIVRRLAAGDSAVLVFLASGHREEDAAVMRLLEEELPKLQRIALPEQPVEAAPRCALPLKVAFSVLRVERGDAAEDVFCRMLLHVEELEKPDGPVVFPVFGRGRALGGLAGANLDADVLHHAATFLCGACSCEVKDLNPGADLLLRADWNALLGFSGEEPPPPPPPAPMPPPPSRPPAAGPPVWLLGCIAASVVLVLITGARALGWRRRGPGLPC